MTYPLHLDLTGRRVVVVGGGPVAARRAAGCLQAGAEVHVVAPRLCEDLADLAEAGQVVWSARDYRAGDLDGAWLVHTATGDAPVDDQVSGDAEAARIWCVRASTGPRSTARTPAVTRSGDLVVGVGTATTGRDAEVDPRRAQAVRDEVAQLLAAGSLPVRRHRPGRGRVALVGGGPGDPELLTLRARRLLAEADVVVVDRLAPQAVLDELDGDVELVDVGKSPDHHPVPQEEINRILVSRALDGKRVVRLKGGDPYVFGRGGEELAACRDAGVEVEVVPGVTSAFAVPAAAGIPVTHRGLARGVTVVTGHEDLDWAGLARVPGTLVVLMGVAALPAICAGLLAAGSDPGTPVAVVERGWTPAQRATVGTLADITERAASRGVRAPAVVVVGAVAALAEESP